jgi:hypothetical protein
VANVEGKQVPFEDEILVGFTDWLRVEKAYKLGASGGGGKKRKNNDVVEGGSNGAGEKGGVEDKRDIEMRVLGAMALRGVS